MLRTRLRALFNRLPQPLQRGVRRLRWRIRRRPESTFIRVAYTTPRQVVLITARHEGVDNIWPLDAHIFLSFQPNLYGIAVKRGSHGADLVRRSGVFVVNFVPATWQDVIFYCGSVSGRKIDKFAGAGLQKEEAQTVNAARLAQSLGALECKVQQVVEVGDHTLFIGEVTHTVMRADAPRLHHHDMRIKEWVDSGQAGASSVSNASPVD